MYRLPVIFFTIVAAGLAQMPGPAPTPWFPADLKQFLTLTDQQVESIFRANSDYVRYQAGKQIRMAQVQREIAEETARETVDPMALGLRYMELESIRRELRDSFARTQQAVVAVLNDAQKLKLKTLEEAAKLQPLITGAQCVNLLAGGGFGGAIAGFIMTVPVGGVLTQYPTATCSTTLMRSGDFTPAPVQP